MIAGIDEAGRGPVLGPLVMAIAAVDPKKQHLLTKMGVKDSKLVLKEKRERLAVEIQERLPHEIIAISAKEIDDAVNGSGDNLNRLEARTSALLIHMLAQDTKIERVIIDSPQVSCDKYEALIRDELKSIDPKGITKGIILQCEIKADYNHPIVGAASILAKVARDAAITDLESEHGPIGTGYMTDPKTQDFLERTWKEGHGFFRKSWASFRRLVEGKAQARLGDYTDAYREIVRGFEVLKEHGFEFLAPTNPYEVLRMRKGKNTLIRYSTGKIVIQGPEKEKVEQLLVATGLR